MSRESKQRFQNEYLVIIRCYQLYNISLQSGQNPRNIGSLNSMKAKNFWNRDDLKSQEIQKDFRIELELDNLLMGKVGN